MQSELLKTAQIGQNGFKSVGYIIIKRDETFFFYNCLVIKYSETFSYINNYNVQMYLTINRIYIIIIYNYKNYVNKVDKNIYCSLINQQFASNLNETWITKNHNQYEGALFIIKFKLIGHIPSFMYKITDHYIALETHPMNFIEAKGQSTIKY